jgi:ABC-type taurine transport system substrate-binding protein
VWHKASSGDSIAAALAGDFRKMVGSLLDRPLQIVRDRLMKLVAFALRFPVCESHVLLMRTHLETIPD